LWALWHAIIKNISKTFLNQIFIYVLIFIYANVCINTVGWNKVDCRIYLQAVKRFIYILKNMNRTTNVNDVNW